MRLIDGAFAARLAADVTTLCACWRFERVDSAVFGATDHDAPIAFGGVTYEPASGLEGATFESSTSLAPGRTAARGAISLGFLTDADVDAGLWDGASVQVWRVDWMAPAHRVMIWSGQLSEITRQGAAFSAELVSLKARLERPIGRVYARTCDADVGDARCGVDLDDPAFRAEATVSTVLGSNQIVLDGLEAFDADWFAGGVLTFLSGDNAGASVTVRRQAGAQLDLLRVPRFALVIGDACVVTAGCEKTFTVCGGKFGNQINYRGHPHMRGPEAVLLGPAADRAHDGGRRG